MARLKLNEEERRRIGEIARAVSYRIAPRELLTRLGIDRADGSSRRRELLIDEILRVGDCLVVDRDLDDGSHRP